MDVQEDVIKHSVQQVIAGPSDEVDGATAAVLSALRQRSLSVLDLVRNTCYRDFLTKRYYSLIPA